MKSFKHLETFESYNSKSEIINEGFIDNIKAGLKNWKDSLQKRAGEFLAKTVKDNKDNPEMQRKLSKLQSEFEKLPQEDKEKIKNIAEKGIAPKIPEVAGEEEIKKGLEEGELVAESLILEKKGSIVGKILRAVGLTGASAGFVGTIISIIKIAMAGSGYPEWLFGLSLGTLGAIFMATTVVSGIVSGIGGAIDNDE